MKSTLELKTFNGNSIFSDRTVLNTEDPAMPVCHFHLPAHASALPSKSHLAGAQKGSNNWKRLGLPPQSFSYEVPLHLVLLVVSFTTLQFQQLPSSTKPISNHSSGGTAVRQAHKQLSKLFVSAQACILSPLFILFRHINNQESSGD